MYVQIDAHTTLNTDVPIAYLEDVVDEQQNPLTRIVFAAEVPDLVTPMDRHTLSELISQPAWQFADERQMGMFPAPTDTPLTQDQLPLDGEDTADYLNRVTRR